MWHEWNDPNMIQLWNFVNQKMSFRIGTIYVVHIRGSYCSWLNLLYFAILGFLHWRSCFVNSDCDMMIVKDYVWISLWKDCDGISGVQWPRFPEFEERTVPIVSNGVRSLPIFAKSRWEVCFVASCLVKVVTPHCARWASLVLAELERLLQGSSAWESRPQCHYHCQIKVQLRHIINHHKIS